jgi:hypothetical protein
MHVNGLTFFVILGLVVWWYKPLRRFLIQRTNRTVKVLLVVLPALFIGRVVYGLSNGERDESLIAAAIVIVLLALWGSLVWLSHYLERRRPTQAQAPEWATISRLPGMPRLPQVPGVTGASGVPGKPGLPSVPGLSITPANVQRAAELAQVASPQVQRAVQVASPHVQRAARTAVQAAAEATADFDRNDVAGSLGRSSGRLFAKVRRAAKASSAPSTAPTAPPSR